MVRKNPPFARTFDLRLKETDHYSDPTFVRTILFSLNKNLVYHIGAMSRVKPLLEVTTILQRVGPTNLRGVVANRQLILGQSDAKKTRQNGRKMTFVSGGHGKAGSWRGQ